MTRLGIDVGGTAVKAAVWKDGRFIRTGQSKFYARPTSAELLTAIADAVGPADFGEIEAVGLCVPGLMNEERTVVTYSINVPGLMGIPLDRLASESLGITGDWTTKIVNDGASTGWDIVQTHQLDGRTLVLTLGTGVGGAVLDDGVPLDVIEGTPGMLGQIDVTLPDVQIVGPDGGAGGLEGYIGVPALKRDYGDDVSAAIATFTGAEPAIRALVRALRIFHAIYRPNCICLAGGVGTRLKSLLPTIRAQVNDRLTSIARADCTIICGDDDFHAARGAALLAASNAVALSH